MTPVEIKEQIVILDKAIASKYTPAGSVRKLSEKKRDLESLLKSIESAQEKENSSSPSQRAIGKMRRQVLEKKAKTISKGVKKILDKYDASVQKFNKGRTAKEISQDAKHIANTPGKHTSAEGNTYYEKRPGHTDISTKDKLKTGGRIKSALNRDRKYTSSQEWEKRYSRSGGPRHYQHHAKGGVIDADMVGENKSAQNINVFGYETKNFDSCAGAALEIGRVRDFISKTSTGTNFTNESAALRSLAAEVDQIFAIEKQTIADNGITSKEFIQVIDLLMFIGIYNSQAGLFVNTSFLDEHIINMAAHFSENK